jgi:hypothetical protein
MSITIQDIVSYSKEHKLGDGARHTRIVNKIFEFSIVGGRSGLYGDFKNTFELAVFDPTTRQFMTSYVVPGADDVIGYMLAEELVELVNNIFKKGDFQVL